MRRAPAVTVRTGTGSPPPSLTVRKKGVRRARSATSSSTSCTDSRSSKGAGSSLARDSSGVRDQCSAAKAAASTLVQRARAEAVMRSGSRVGRRW